MTFTDSSPFSRMFIKADKPEIDIERDSGPIRLATFLARFA